MVMVLVNVRRARVRAKGGRTRVRTNASLVVGRCVDLNIDLDLLASLVVGRCVDLSIDLDLLARLCMRRPKFVQYVHAHP